MATLLVVTPIQPGRTSLYPSAFCLLCLSALPQCGFFTISPLPGKFPVQPPCTFLNTVYLFRCSPLILIPYTSITDFHPVLLSEYSFIAFIFKAKWMVPNCVTSYMSQLWSVAIHCFLLSIELLQSGCSAIRGWAMKKRAQTRRNSLMSFYFHRFYSFSLLLS